MTVTGTGVQAPYGTWRSPLTAELLSEHSRTFAGVEVDGGHVYWLEQRPTEDRAVVVRRAPAGTRADVTAPGVDVGSTVHEGTNRSFVVAGGVVWYSDKADQRIYRQDQPGAEPRAVSPEGPWRFAEPIVD